MPLNRNLLNAKNWNQALDYLQDGTLLAGSGAKLAAMTEGAALSFDGPPAWRHPWFTSATWNAKNKQWQAMILTAGFVNGQDPQIPGVTIPDAKGNPVTATVTDFPQIPILGWRIPGSVSPDVVPAFFTPLGVGQSSGDSLSINPDSGVVTETDFYQPPSNVAPRSLLAVDLYIAQARPAYQGQAEVVDAVGASGSQVDYNVTYNTQTLDVEGSAPRLQQAPKLPANVTPSDSDQLTGNYTDAGEDYLLISTIFLLSPPNISSSTPDGAWTPYVQHNVFWNLAYGVKNIPPPTNPPPVTLVTGLAAGFGDTLINSMLSQINDYSDQIEDAVNAVSTAGIFWTV